MKYLAVGTLLLLGAIALVGCRGGESGSGSAPEEAPEPPEPPAAVEEPPPAALRPPTEEQVETVKREGKVQVRLATEKGDITLELDGAAAPIAVANFLNLVGVGFYTDMPFHRVEAGFVIQAGDPALVGRPPVGYTITDERSPIRHLRGTIAMARLYQGGRMVPNSASTQFYITLADTPHLDQMGFTAFGRVVAGADVPGKIAAGDKIREATVVSETSSATG